MARPLTEAQRAELSPRTYELSVRGRTNVEIARELGINEHTVSSLIRLEKTQRREERLDVVEEALATYREIIREGWYHLERLRQNSTSLNVAGVMNSIINARQKMDDILGLQAPKKWRGNTTHENMDLSKFTLEELELLERLLETATYDDVGPPALESYYP